MYSSLGETARSFLSSVSVEMCRFPVQPQLVKCSLQLTYASSRSHSDEKQERLKEKLRDELGPVIVGLLDKSSWARRHHRE